MRNATLIARVLASAAAAWLSPAAAGSFTISPLRVDLSPAVRTAAVTVRNEDAAEVVVQAEAMAWAQPAGSDAYEATRELLVSPAVFTLPAGGSQVVRVALRRDSDPGRELSYRLWLQEVPQTASADFTGLRVAMKLSLPVFVTPAGAQPRLTWSATRDADGRLVVRADNSGNAHERVLSFAAEPVDVAGAPLHQPVATYVLPGQHRSWTLPHNNDDSADHTARAKAYRLKGVTEGGEVTAELAVGQ